MKFQAFFASFAESVFFTGNLTGKKFVEARLLVSMGRAENSMMNSGRKVIKTQYIPVALCSDAANGLPIHTDVKTLKKVKNIKTRRTRSGRDDIHRAFWSKPAPKLLF